MFSKIAMSLSFVVILTVLGCGASEKSSQFVGTPDKGKSDQGAIPGLSSIQSPEVPVQRDIDIGAKVYLQKSDAPACDDTTARELIYIKDEGQFHYCDAGEWTVIELKGKNGRDGVDGKDGSQGIAGRDGSNGVNGTDGQDGQDGENASNLVWHHPISGKKFFLGRSFGLSGLFTWVHPSLCAAGSHSPTDTEFTDAVEAGLWNHIGLTINADATADHDKVILEHFPQPNYDGLIKAGHTNGNTALYGSGTPLGFYTITLSKSIYSVCMVD